jgi:ankyrin repeat protein
VNALHVAAFNGSLGVAKLLVARGADVKAKDQEGNTPLANAKHWLIECPCRTEEEERQWGALTAFLEKVESMISQEERIAFAKRSWRFHVSSVLQEAVERGAPSSLPPSPSKLEAERARNDDARVTLTRLLACYAEDVDASDHDGSTALHAAALSSSASAIGLILDAGANIEAKTNLEETALHFAAREGKLAAARLLLKRAANVEARTKFGATPLDYAERHKHGDWEEVMTLLRPNVPWYH